MRAEGFELYPAVDILGGRCVRLVRGSYETPTVYDEDPVAAAMRLVEAGARRLHVVDLDAARGGGSANIRVVEEICRTVPVPVQVGGGVRTVETASAVLSAGASRVVVGTAFWSDPTMSSRLVEAGVPFVVALDVRGSDVVVEGWTEGTGISITEAVGRVRAACAVVVTSVERDGTMEGPDMETICRVLGSCEVPVIASGGVSSLDDLTALATLEVSGRRLAGVVIGKALYEGRLRLEEALAAVSETRP